MLKNDLILLSVKSERTFINLKQNETNCQWIVYSKLLGIDVAECASVNPTPTFVEEHHNLLKGLHEVDVVVAVLLDLQQQAELGQTLGGEGFQQKAVLLQKQET